MLREGRVFVVRQFLILCGACLYSFSSGILVAFPAVLNPAILDPNAVIKATPDQASWIAASLGIAGLIGLIIITPIFEFFGRKTSNIVINLFTVCGCCIFYVAQDVHSLTFARLAQGLSAGGIFISIISVCECVSPKRRGYFMVINKVFLGLGSLFCHSLAFVMNWRQIAAWNALPSCISVIVYAICAESPSFYAKRGQFDKCEKTFKWFRGNSLAARRELKELVSAQASNLEKKRKGKKLNTFKQTMNILWSKEFRKSFFIVTLATLSLESSGRHFLLAYVTHILEEVTNDRSLAMYVSVAFDGILITALSVSCFTIRYFKRRTLLFRLGFCSAFLMFLISLTIFLGNKFILQRNTKWVIPTTILFHTFISNIGLVPIAFALTGEVFSLEQRGAGSFVSGIVFITFYTLVMKLVPKMIALTGVEGTYSIFGLSLFICLVLLWIVLPETKDKTLQQIEDEIKGITRNHSDTELSENKELVVLKTNLM